LVGCGVGDLFLPPDLLLGRPPDLLRGLAVSRSRLGDRFFGGGEGEGRFRGEGEAEEAAGFSFSFSLGTSFFSSGFLDPPDLGFTSFFDFFDFFLLSLSLLESLELELESLLESLLELLLELLVFRFFLSLVSLLSLLRPFLSSPLLSELLPRDRRPFSFSSFSGFPLSSPPAPCCPGAMLFR